MKSSTMIDLGRDRGPMIGGMHLIHTATAVDCTPREVGLRRTFRSFLDCIVPTCICSGGFQPPPPPPPTATTNHRLSPSSSTSERSSSSDSEQHFSSSPPSSSSSSSTATVLKGTFFGQRNGRVSFCLQDPDRRRRRGSGSPSGFPNPLLILEFGFPTAYLAREMQHGLLRIALVAGERPQPQRRHGPDPGLFGVPVWSVFCNGRKVGFATKRQVRESDVATLKLMQSVSVGAGVLPPADGEDGSDGVMYLRASFRRVIGSEDSQAFHMINPDKGDGSGNNGGAQELSIFLLRSSS